MLRLIFSWEWNFYKKTRIFDFLVITKQNPLYHSTRLDEMLEWAPNLSRLMASTFPHHSLPIHSRRISHARIRVNSGLAAVRIDGLRQHTTLQKCIEHIQTPINILACSKEVVCFLKMASKFIGAAKKKFSLQYLKAFWAIPNTPWWRRRRRHCYRRRNVFIVTSLLAV